MRTIRTSSNYHDQQSQSVVSRILAICVSEIRFLRIVWFYRGSRGLLLYFYKRVRQTRFRRRSGVGDRENVFSASPPPTRSRGRPPSAREYDPHARAIFTECARELDCVRARLGPPRASVIALFVCLLICLSRTRPNTFRTPKNAPRTPQDEPRTIQDDPRTPQNSPEQPQNVPERSQNAPRMTPEPSRTTPYPARTIPEKP